jgi:type IV pilus assembly protein PilW
MRPFGSQKTRGFTLIELLISMALSGIVISAIYTLFISQNRSYSIQEQVSEMQQNARVAMDRIVRDVRMAGYGVVNDGAFVIGGIDYDYDGADDFQTNNDSDRLSADGIMIRRADSPPLGIITHSGIILSVCFPSNFEAGDILTITAGNNYQAIQVSQIEDTSASPCPARCAGGGGKCDKINFSSGQSAYNNPGGLGDWANNGTVAKFAETAYFIDVKSDGSPVLKRSINGQPAQTLAENIEDLQIVYQLSDDATWYDTLSPAQQVQDIRSVRINVLARTDKMDPHFSGKREAIEDHAAGNADKYRRRLLTTVINVRNMGL